MQRSSIEPRSDWQRRVEEVGLLFHHTPEGLYWDESAYYRFSSAEVDSLEGAANDLHQLCLSAVQHVIDKDRFSELGIPPEAVPVIRRAWEEEPPSVYGRFDFAFDGTSPPKMLEYNADTPTSLLESSVVQWYWLEDRFKGADQFNSIHERLIRQWTELKFHIRSSPLYFTCATGSLEDDITVGYLRDTADQAGITTAFIPIESIGWHEDFRYFVDLQGNLMGSVFKLYPWEWLIREEFGPNVLSTYHQMQWIEPIWKLVLSSKGILPILWELNPGHPNLLEAYFDTPRHMRSYVRKPIFSREGANITLQDFGTKHLQTEGSYGTEGYIFQDLAHITPFDGNYPVIGCWVVEGDAVGMGLRESTSPITDNYSRFVPHMFV